MCPPESAAVAVDLRHRWCQWCICFIGITGSIDTIDLIVRIGLERLQAGQCVRARPPWRGSWARLLGGGAAPSS
jgi:hypothetical protein